MLKETRLGCFFWREGIAEKEAASWGECQFKKEKEKEKANFCHFNCKKSLLSLFLMMKQSKIVERELLFPKNLFIAEMGDDKRRKTVFTRIVYYYYFYIHVIDIRTGSFCEPPSKRPLSPDVWWKRVWIEKEKTFIFTKITRKHPAYCYISISFKF